jgi:hypothetical protein
MTVTAMFVHFGKSKAKEETFISKYFAYVTIGTFVAENMIQTF